MTLVSHKYKFIYLKNYKVAGTSVEDFFSKWCINPNSDFTYQTTISVTDSSGDENIDDYGIVGRTNGTGSDVWRCHSSGVKIKEEFEKDENLGLDKFEEYLKFCVIRNPYDKMVSFYFWQTQHPLGHHSHEYFGVSFKEYCKMTQLNNLNIHGVNGKSLCDYFIRYEHLEADIVELCKLLNLPEYDISTLPRHKSGIRDSDKSYREYYDEETKQIVYESHKKEFEMFGYEF